MAQATKAKTGGPAAPSKAEAAKPESTQPDAEQWTATWGRLGTALTRLLKNPRHPSASKGYDTAALLEALVSVSSSLMRDPQKLVEIQMQFLGDVSRIWTSAFLPDEKRKPVIEPVRSDRRFKHPDWTDQVQFDVVKQIYLVTAQAMRTMVAAAVVEDPKKREIVAFLVEQYLNAIVPSNFVATNPEVLRRTVETRGANLVGGLANLLEDVAEGKGIVKRRAPNTFVLGENLACTPGGIVYENDLMQLIQYSPATESVSRRPLIYVPPLVNKYYMIDLQPKSSLIRWLTEQGHTVFCVSWVDPDESHRHCAIDDYIESGVLKAIEVVRDITGEPDADMFGFCMGGTLIAIADAVLAARGEGSRIGSSTLIGSLVDFSDMRAWSGFLHEGHVEALDGHVSGAGYISKTDLQRLFALVRSNDLIWSSFVDHYLLDREAPPSDLLFWFEDGSHIPEAFLTSYNRKLLLNNHLSDPGKVELLGEKLDLAKITSPVMAIGLRDDHVSAWEAVYFGTRFFGGPVEFILGGSGHNAGVINPPSANKHGFWTSDKLADTADGWFAGATRNEGSWWPYWSAWLKAKDGNGDVPARALGSKDYPVIEAAPGRFILAGNK